MAANANESGDRRRSPSRNIVVCCDGTWNRPAGALSTNVALTHDVTVQPGERIAGEAWSSDRFCEKASLADPWQLVYYQTGVGTAPWAALRALHGATGTGVRQNIIAAYAWVAANYRDGDRLFLFGFSRGAFVARSLAGVVERCGLLYPDHAHEADDIFEIYRDRDLIGAADHISGGLLNGKARQVPIHFLGVWDTVGALGIPFLGLQFNLLSIWRNQFHDLSLSNGIHHAYHAIAMDEMRPSFMPTLWEVPDSRPPERPVEQVWFRGVHADVGGGYPERQLANETLRWMLDRAAAAGLRIDEAHCDGVCRAEPPRLHDSIGRRWRLLGAWPRACPTLAAWPADSRPDRRARSIGVLHASAPNGLPPEQDLLPGVVAGRANPIRAPAGVETVTIRADVWWNRTGLALEAGRSYRLRCSGRWRDAAIEAGPEGWEKPGVVLGVFERFRRRRDARWFAVIAMVDSHSFFAFREHSVAKLVYYLLVRPPVQLTSRLVTVGAECVLHPVRDGLLYCFANDLWWMYGNNSGEITLTVEEIGAAGERAARAPPDSDEPRTPQRTRSGVDEHRQDATALAGLVVGGGVGLVAGWDAAGRYADGAVARLALAALIAAGVAFAFWWTYSLLARPRGNRVAKLAPWLASSALLGLSATAEFGGCADCEALLADATLVVAALFTLVFLVVAAVASALLLRTPPPRGGAKPDRPPPPGPPR